MVAVWQSSDYILRSYKLQVFGLLPTSALLSNLSLSSGDLSPLFSQNINSYTSDVDMM